MNCLKHSNRIKDNSLFQQIYKSGRQFHKPAFALFYLQNQNHNQNKIDEANFNVGFVSSKKVGNAVFRNRSRRLLRAVLFQFCEKLESGAYVIVAKEAIHKTEFSQLLTDFKFGIKYLKAYKQ